MPQMTPTKALLDEPTNAMIVDGLREVQAEMGKLLSVPGFNRVQDAIDFLQAKAPEQEGDDV